MKFCCYLYREIALEVLHNEPIGSFIVRESTTKTGCLALSIRVPKEFQPAGIAHYLILKTGKGYKIKVRQVSITSVLILCDCAILSFFQIVFVRPSSKRSSGFRSN